MTSLFTTNTLPTLLFLAFLSLLPAVLLLVPSSHRWYETYKELFGSHAKWGKALDIESLKKGPSGDEEALRFSDMSNGGEYSRYDGTHDLRCLLARHRPPNVHCHLQHTHNPPPHSNPAATAALTTTLYPSLANGVHLFPSLRLLISLLLTPSLLAPLLTRLARPTLHTPRIALTPPRSYQKSMAVLTTFEEALTKNKSGFLVGAGLTYVDLALWSSLLELEEEDNMPDWAGSLKLPALKAFKERVEQRENIQAYLQSDRLMPRIKKVDDDYQYVKGQYSMPKQEEVEVVMN